MEHFAHPQSSTSHHEYAEELTQVRLSGNSTVVDELGNEHRASLYFAEVGYIDAARQPYSWYKRFVIDGARQHALPGEYVNALAGRRGRRPGTG